MTNFNERTNTLLYENISLTLYSRKCWCFWDVWEMGGVPMIASPCKRVRAATDWLRVSRSTAILCTLSKSDCVFLITWSPSGYTPVRSECPDTLSSSCLLIKMWQLTKAHRSLGMNRKSMSYVIWHIYTCMYLSLSLCIYIYIYIYIHRERERERDTYMCMCVCVI